MADYKNFFNNLSPLNLYNIGMGNKPTTSYMLRQDGTVAHRIKSAPKMAYETDEAYKQRLQLEELEYLEYLKRQNEYNLKIASLKSQARIQRIIEPKKNIPNVDIEKLVEKDVAYAIDPITGKFKNPNLALRSYLKETKEREELEEKYLKDYNEVNALAKALNAYDPNVEEEEDNRDSEEINAFKELVKKDNLKRGVFENEDEFNAVWEQLNEDSRLKIITSILGRKYFTGNALEEFKDSDYQQRFDMLASYIRNNPFYESLAEKHKKNIDWGDNLFSKDWKAETEYQTQRFLRGITGGNKWYEVGHTFFDVFEGGLSAAGGKMGELVGGLVGAGGEYLLSRLEGMGTEEDTDDYIASRADAYINKKSLELYDKIQNSATDKEKEDMVKEFEAMSQEASPWYRAEKGTSLTELTKVKGDSKKDAEFNSKLRQYANLATIAELYSPEAALKNLKEFWENTIAHNQTPLDKVLRTGGTFVNTAAADIAGFGAVLLNFLNPYSIKEGYSDALVQHNPLLEWANNLLETGAWTSDLLRKYKDLGVNALLIYQDVSDQNAILSANDFYDIVGQYGFTAATTLLSLGGSAAVKGIATNAAKKALTKGITGTVTKGLTTGIQSTFSSRAKEVREALKKGLASNATKEELTAAKEAAAKIGLAHMYRGNLMVGALMGTAEGALEAKSTYETFIKDNIEGTLDRLGIKLMFDERQLMLNNATNDDLRNYMLSNGYMPAFYVSGPTEGEKIAEYTPEQYAQARKELLKSLDEARQAAYDKVEDDAADAAFTNFTSNSCINGVLNVLAKEAIMSRDVREASRMFKGKNKYKDLIDVVKKGDSWEAVVKKAASDNSKRNLWNKIKDVTGKTLKTAAGEFGEEYTQGLSDLASRAALLYDLDLYINTVFDKDTREAFLTDWSGMLNVGLNSIMTNATNQENIKAGLFGALSSMIGGASPAGIFNTIRDFKKGRLDSEKGFWNTAWWAAKNLRHLYQGGIQEAIRDSNEELESAQRLVEATNAWLNTAKNLELLTHMGGAMGFKKVIEDAILSEDELNAHDGKLGLAVENAFMLQALEGTDYGRSMQGKIAQNAELLDIAQDDNNFDADGNYIGNNTESGDAINVETDWVKTAINTFKNLLGDASRSTNMTDRLIVERIGKNASEFINLQNEVAKALKRVKNIFRNDNLDPLAEQAFVYALMSQQNTRERKDSLSEKLHNAVHNNKLTDSEKETLLESELNDDALDFFILNGTLESATSRIKTLLRQSNQAKEDANNKKLSSENRRAAKNRWKSIERELKALQLLVDTETKRRTPDIIEDSADASDSESKDKPEKLVQPEVRTTFSVGDMANRMNNQLRAYVIANKQKFSKEQLDIIDEFLSISRKYLAEENNDIALTNEEVAKDYVDLATLERRSDAYDNHLIQYINNPKFLSTTAATLRQKERTRTLKYLYKEDLLKRVGESVLDYKERIDNKIESLRELGKEDDANILNNLLYENKEIADLNNNITEAGVAAIVYRAFKNIKEEDINRLDAFVKTLISNSGMSLQDIKKTLDKADTLSIVEHLAHKTSDGQIALNKHLLKRGIEALDLNDDAVHNEEVLSSDIQSIKDFVDFYSNIKNDKSFTLADTVSEVDGSKAGKQTSKKLGSGGSGNSNGGSKGSRGSGGRPKLEHQLLTITTPGDLDKNSDSDLYDFLEGKNVSLNVKNIDIRKNPHVYLAVIKKCKLPVVFAVQLVKGAGQHNDGKTISIGNKVYLIIGVMNHAATGYSSTIAELGEQAYKELGSQEEGRLLAYGGSLKGGPTRLIELELSAKDPKSVSELNQGDEKNLNELYTEDEVRTYVEDILKEKREHGGGLEEDPNNEGRKTLRDGNHYPILRVEKPINGILYPLDIYDFQIEDGSGNVYSLKDIIQSINPNDLDSIRNAIELLKNNPFFEAYFDAWTDQKFDREYGGVNTSTISRGDNKNLYAYEWLLGDFIFLGYPYPSEEGSSKSSYLNPRIHTDAASGKKTIRIDGIFKNKDLAAFEFELPSGNDATREQQAMMVLYNLLHLTENNGNEESIANTQFNFWTPQIVNDRIINNHYKEPNAVERQRKRLIGLIKAGFLKGTRPYAVRRDMHVLNPFYKESPSSTKSNDSKASSFDPNPRGVGKGGTLNPEDGGKKDGNPDTHLDTIKKALTEGQKRALKIVDRIIARSKRITQANSNSETYSSEDDGTEFSRVTSLKTAYVGGKAEEFEASKEVADISHAYGNTIDAVDRAAIEVLNAALEKKETLSVEELYKRVLKDEKFKGKDGIPNWEKEDMEMYLELVMQFHLAAVSAGWTIVPKDIKAFGYVDVVQNGVKIGRIPVAGTLDLLAYDKKGLFIIIDAKNLHVNTENNALELNKNGWEVQVSSYLMLLEQQNEDMVFVQNYILPTFSNYSTPLMAVEVAEDGMTVENFSPNSEPKLLADPDLKSYKVEDFLYPVDTLLPQGYDYDALSEADKKRVIFDSGNGSSDGIIGGGAAPKGPLMPKDGSTLESPSDTPGGSIDDLFNEDDFESRRTTRLARYTEFINNHIAPLKKVKVGVISKAATIIKELFGKSGKQRILEKELANIFFNGDTNKLLLVLKGQKITEDNLPNIIHALKVYYSSYIQNKDAYVANITRRYHLSKVVCEYLKGNVSLDALEELLSRHNAKIDSISELLEYMASPNKEETAKSIISKLETSKAGTKEKYNLNLEALNTTIESMQAKLDFLNSESAERMLMERVNSVHQAISSNLYEYNTYGKGGTIEKMLTSKSGSYGAMKILRDILLRTKNDNFKKLAGILLRQIKEKSITVPLTIEDGGINFVEGSTKGRAITIQKTSLDSYEHLERVILHEMLHAVVEASPEVKNTLQDLLDLAINSIQKATGKTIPQIKDEYYGLANVEEFISEFFTNYAFLETLKTIGSNTYDNIFDRVIGGLKEKITGDKSLYSQISETMESVLNSTNIESTYKKTETVKLDTGKIELKTLPNDIQLMVLSKGFTEEEFNSITLLELEHLLECCK